MPAPFVRPRLTPPENLRLLGETYRHYPTDALVVVLDHHYDRRGRTGSYVVQTLAGAAPQRFLAPPSTLVPLGSPAP